MSGEGRAARAGIGGEPGEHTAPKDTEPSENAGRPDETRLGDPGPGETGNSGGAGGRGGRRGLGLWVLACVAGAGLALLASGRDWATVTVGETLSGAHSGSTLQVTGGDVAPVLTPLALAAGAAALAVLATRGVWRRVVGVVLALFGAGVVTAALTSATTPAVLDAIEDRNTLAVSDSLTVSMAWTWPGVAVAGGLVLAAAGVYASIRGGKWGGMSDRYDRPGSRPRQAAPSDRAMWDAIDGGDDPTDDEPQQSRER